MLHFQQLSADDIRKTVYEYIYDKCPVVAAVGKWTYFLYYFKIIHFCFGLNFGRFQ